VATIAIVGGGLAGLACGLRLERAGHRVRVLERATSPGGRARSERCGDFRLDTGAPVVTGGQRRLLAMSAEAGMGEALRSIAFGRDARWRDGHLALPSPGDALGLARAPGDGRAVLRAALDLLRPDRAFDPGRDASADAALRAARADALSWWPDPPDGGFAAAAVSALRPAFPPIAPRTFAGGVGALAAALARRLDVATGCEVLRVETGSDGAQLELRAGEGILRSRADAVVVAVPATRVLALCPKLTPEERGFFEAARSEPVAVVHLLFERCPRALTYRSVVFGPGAGLEISSLVAEHAKPGVAPHGAGVLRVVLAPDAAARMHRASDASVADLALENLAYSPVGRLRPDGFAVWRHADLAPRFDAAHCRRLARFTARLERSPRLAFAGDFLAGPSTDAAVASGAWAAAEISRSL
jgi:oxygen-dependent protoporphyrinogen oxidase